MSYVQTDGEFIVIILRSTHDREITNQFFYETRRGIIYISGNYLYKY